MDLYQNNVVSVELGPLERRPPRYDDSLRQVIADCIRQGLTASEIAQYLRIDRKTPWRMSKLIDAFGTHAPPPCGQTGRPRTITVGIEEGMFEWMNAQDQAPYLDEIQFFLRDEYGVECTISTISRCLKRSNWTRKKRTRLHPDRDEVARAAFRSRTSIYQASQLVVVDESGCNTRTGERVWGFAPSGMVYRMTQTRQRSRNWSVLPALGINGFIDYELFPGAYDAERFINFIRKLALKMTPYPGPRSVLILDNCRTHHAPELRGFLDQQGIRMEFLPAYSPDFSPIELTFSIMKSWIRRNRQLLVDERMSEDFAMFLHMAVEMSDIKDRARDLFIQCHYTVDDEDHDVPYEDLAILQ